MSAPPLVTVGLPVRNGERFLRAAMESVLAQEYAHFELVVSDNASTDATPRVAEEFAARDARVRFTRLERNEGAAANYNRVFSLARGRYFRWQAADDLVSPDSLDRCVAELEAHPEAVLAYPRTHLIDEAGAPAGEYDDRLDLRERDAPTRFEQTLRLLGECNAVFGLVRTEALRRTRLIGPYPGADMVLLAELSLHGAFHALEGPRFYRRVHPASSSSDKSDASQFEFYRPGPRPRLFLRAFRHHAELTRALWRCPLPPWTKLRGLGVLARKAVQGRHAFLADLGRAWRALASR